MSTRDQNFLEMARYLARKSNARNTHGAILMKGGRVIGTGFNKYRNNPEVVAPEHIRTGCSTHAEAVAIKDANFNVKGATMYVARVNRRGEDRDSKPCPECMTLIRETGIKKVVYTTSAGILYPGFDF